MATWHSCNILNVGPDRRHLWQFTASNSDVNLVREQVRSGRETLPTGMVSKDWQTLWRKKLNIAWLPAEKVFLRVLQLPAADLAEVQSMVEFQLEKISPLPVAQIVWSIEVLQKRQDNLQTVIVMIVARDLVEKFLGDLEGQGFLADRLELPVLDQLLASTITGDGAWFYPKIMGENTAMVAWWYGGVLRNVTLVNAPSTPAGVESLKGQLRQMAWAGDLEGWLTSPPHWHLVAENEVAEFWQPILRGISENEVEVMPPLPPPQLAAITARRAAVSPRHANLMPPEFATRYQQQFIDRLWMRGLMAVIMIYAVGVVCYFGFLQVLKFRYNQVNKEVRDLKVTYTNSLQLKARIQVLQDQVSLKFAALDCWQKAVELLPEDASLTYLVFSKGKVVTLQGTMPTEQQADLTDYSLSLSKVRVRDKPLFSKVDFPTSLARGNNLTWTIKAQLNAVEGE